MTTTLDTETFESRDLFRKAEIHFRRNKYARAAGLLTEALKISPNHPLYLSYLGVCVAMRGDVEGGEKMCMTATAMRSKEPMMYVNMGRVLLCRGQRQEAREHFMRAYRMDNTNAPAALELSRMGVRRRPVLKFLPRNHPLNVYLGKLRHRISCWRSQELKKQ
ncbi:MAG: tetratricopeptide repeat protein [Candidatus Krumholzibacteriota bacterium]|nr:tetratricopeptide repeat protein [Candidatus Krumholzibacteriota bacterium]